MRNYTKTIALATGLGSITGMRSMSGLAFVSRHLSQHSRFGRRLGTVDKLLRSKRVAGVMSAMAASEMAADKMPVMPKRTQASALAGRAAFGALVGLAAADYRRGPKISAAIVGALSAVGSTFLFYHLRRWATDRTNMPDWAVALAEDAVVITAGRQLAKRLNA